ncbi:MAG TPA: DNA primase, partial [Candidatus Angelobacter sp.]|nr:DNA primase [Candidatus Angelobacter sp.]
MSAPVDLAHTVKQQADIIRVVGDYVQLKKAGAQNFSGLCPFHQEKTASFSVHATRQFFHCFGCGKSGDVFSFIQEIEKVSFMEAVRLVAQKFDIKLPKMQYSSEHEAADAKLRGQLIEMHERACAFFQEQLRRPEAAQARQYLSNRGLNEETIREFKIGFAPDSGFVLKDKWKGEYNDELMRTCGLFTWKEGAEGNIYSKFRNRIMFPIANEQGRIIAFTGRTLATDEKAGPKYLNSPETAIYSKSRVLFNLDKAKEAIRKLEYAIIVEGQMDCIAVYSAGFHNVVASSGTAFTETQVRLLGRFSKDIVVNFDPDTAGATATDKSLGMLLEEEFKVKVLRLPAGFDPDLFIRKNGAQTYRQALKGSLIFFDYLVDRVMAMFPVRTPEGKKNAVNYLLPHLHHVPNKIEREALANDIAQKLGIDSEVLRQEFRSAATNRASREVKAAFAVGMKPSEKILLRAAAAVTEEERPLRRQVLRAMAEERLHEGLNSEALLQQMLEAGEEVDDPMQLPMSDADRQLLASALMKEDEPLTPELVDGALEDLRHRMQIYRREREIKRGIVEAERRNDVAALVRLKQEKLELDR